MPQRKPFDELSPEDKGKLISLRQSFLKQYKRYLDLTERRKSFSSRRNNFESGEILDMEAGKMFEDILRSSNKKGDSFVNVYRIMVQKDVSIQRALDMADPKDQVDKRTLKRYIDEAYIEFAKKYKVPTIDDQLAVTDKIEFSTTITDYVDDEIVIVCTMCQKIDKLTWIYESLRSYSCYSYKKKQKISLNKAFWEIEKTGALSDLSFGSKRCWEYIKYRMEEVFDCFPELRLYSDAYELFFREKDKILYYSDELFAAIPGGKETFFGKYRVNPDTNVFMDLNFQEVEVLPVEEAHILQSQDNFIRRLNASKKNGDEPFEDFKKFRMAYSGPVRKYFKEVDQLIEETGDIDRSFEINEVENMLYSFSLQSLLPVETLLYLFVQFFGPNDIKKSDAWKYHIYLKEYITQIRDQFFQNERTDNKRFVI